MTVSSAERGSVPEFHQGHRLALALEYAGIGTGEMADYLGVHPQSVTRWTKGKTPVKRQTLMLWALATGVSIEWLETGQAPSVETEPVCEHGPDCTLRACRDSNPKPSVLVLVHSAIAESVREPLTPKLTVAVPRDRHLSAVS